MRISISVQMAKVAIGFSVINYKLDTTNPTPNLMNLLIEAVYNFYKRNNTCFYEKAFEEDFCF